MAAAAGKSRNLRVVRGGRKITSTRRTAIREATVEDVEELLQTWGDDVLACRSGLMSHNFMPYDAIHNKRLRYWYITLRCPRCTTQKLYEMNEYGEVLGHAWYRYPPGYQAKGRGRILGAAKDRVRREAVTRLFETHELTGRDLKEDLPRPSTLIRLQGQ